MKEIKNDEKVTPHKRNLLAVGEKIVMQTALATVENPEILRSEEKRILVDIGSQRTYITKELADNLQLKTRETQKYSVYMFGNKKPKKITTSLVELTIKTQKGEDILIKASIVPQITGLVQRIPINIQEQQNLKKTYHLADNLPQQVQTSTLGLLTGNDYYHKLIMGERIQVKDGLYLIKSNLDWILSGRLSCSKSETVMENAMSIMMQTSILLPLEVHHLAHESTVDIFEPHVEDLWNLEMICIKKPNKLEDDDAIRQTFKDSIIEKNGRYEVTWSWKEVNPNLSENHDLCVGRLKFWMKRFESNPELLERYNNVI